MTLFALPNIASLIFKAGGEVVRQYGEPGGGGINKRLLKACKRNCQTFPALLIHKYLFVLQVY